MLSLTRRGGLNLSALSKIQLKYRNTKVKNTRIKIKDSKTAYSAFMQFWNDDTIELQEEFKVLLLNRANEVLGLHTLSKGGMTGTLVDIKLLLAVAIKSASCGIILAHNHPSGNLNPSEMDKRLYEKIKKAAEYLDINVLDNLIITKEGYYSFADEVV